MNLFFSIEGRVGRLGFIGVNLASVAFIMALVMLVGLVDPKPRGQQMNPAMGVILFIGMMTYIWIHIANTAKRLHDLGASAGWMLLGFVPIANILLAIALLFVPGDEQRNEYGASPSSPSTSETHGEQAPSRQINV